MSRIVIRKNTPTPRSSDMRKITIYGEVPGTGAVVDELEDGATITLATPTATAQIVLDAKNLSGFTQQLAAWFGLAVVHPTEWRDQLEKVVMAVCERNGARCLDDDIDRRVVVSELIVALAALAMPKSRD